MKAIISLAAAALLVPVLAQDLSFQVPPPQCLNNCIHQFGACNLCMPGNVFTTCIQKGCGFRDVSYASAYYGSICSDGGYVSYDTNPPANVYIATDSRTNCPAISAPATNCTAASTTPSKRSVTFKA